MGGFTPRNRPKVILLPYNAFEVCTTVLLGGRMNTILIVEDNEQLSSFYSRIIEHVGFKVVHAYSCKDALNYLQGNLPQLILLDMSLSDGSGQIVIDYIRQSDHRQTHIVVVSGDARYKRRAVPLGIDGFLFKPVSIPALLDTVRRFIAPEAKIS
jgi:CheY-like chemotaxis protein